MSSAKDCDVDTNYLDTSAIGNVVTGAFLLNLNAQGVEVTSYESTLAAPTCYCNIEILDEFKEFRRQNYLTTANRRIECFRDVIDEVWTRDLFGGDARWSR